MLDHHLPVVFSSSSLLAITLTDGHGSAFFFEVPSPIDRDCAVSPLVLLTIPCSDLDKAKRFLRELEAWGHFTSKGKTPLLAVRQSSSFVDFWLREF